MTELISIESLNENLGNKDLILLDASLRITAEGQNSEYKLLSITGARYFNIKENFSERNSPFPNTHPSEKQFELECQKLGINQTSKIVVFDDLGIYSSPRLWWMFKIMGHNNISVLNGGLPAWINKGYAIEKRKDKNYKLGNFKAAFQKPLIKTYQDILDNIDTKTFKVIDARSNGRFNGTENEPRKHLKSGHIPNSINIPYQWVLNKGQIKSKLELKKIFAEICLDEKELIFSCGSGITACIVLLACNIVNKKAKFLYDGSWSEWAELQNLKTIVE